MSEDERDISHLDPANLLPFECAFEPENPAIRIPKVYLGNDRVNSDLF